MPDNPSNGHDPSRMDRMERMMDFIIADHARFEEEHRKLLDRQNGLSESQDRLVESQEKLQHGMQQLLTSQVILTDMVGKTAKTLDVFIEQTNLRFQDRAESQTRSDGKLNTLIEIVDAWIRRQPTQ